MVASRDRRFPPWLDPVLSVGSVLNWLRAGYPHGVPDPDYVPLFALLARRLPEADVRQVANALIEQGAIPADRVDVGVLIT